MKPKLANSSRACPGYAGNKVRGAKATSAGASEKATCPKPEVAGSRTRAFGAPRSHAGAAPAAQCPHPQFGPSAFVHPPLSCLSLSPATPRRAQMRGLLLGAQSTLSQGTLTFARVNVRAHVRKLHACPPEHGPACARASTLDSWRCKARRVKISSMVQHGQRLLRNVASTMCACHKILSEELLLLAAATAMCRHCNSEK